MKILSANALNFSSYKEVSFDFENIGLSLVYGSTGSGKSTLQDLVPWVLFGKTSKNGNVSEVCRWSSEGQVTLGSLIIDLNDKHIKIVRKRGSSQQNDLYWSTEGSNELIRGKDLADSQNKLNGLIKQSYDLFCQSFYYNEFSETRNFFYDKPKQQRELLENIANLDLPVRVLQAVQEAKKKNNKEVLDFSNKINNISYKIEHYQELILKSKTNCAKYEKSKDMRIKALRVLQKNFQNDKDKEIEELGEKSFFYEEEKKTAINSIIDKMDFIGQRANDVQIDHNKCTSCGQILNEESSLKYKEQQLKDRFNDYSRQLVLAQSTANPYLEQLKRAEKREDHYLSEIVKLKSEVNPYIDEGSDLEQTLEENKDKLDKNRKLLEALNYRISCLNQLQDLSFELRGVLLENSVCNIENKTNSLLSNYFESEFSIKLQLDGKDSLEVCIIKNGYKCAYTQLSKGQRCLLSLCFSLSIMKETSNKSSTTLNLVCFDEALDGMDTTLKIKAFGLFQDLNKEYSSILIAEHDPEFQELFTNRYKVTLVADESKIQRE